MKIKKSIILILFLIMITMLFFTYKVVITYDSSHYLWLTSLLTPQGDFSTWDVARGPIFPLFIRISNILFGQSTNGLLTGMFIFYIIMLVTCYFIYRDILKDEEHFNKKYKIIYTLIFIVLVVINPMIIGYYHTLLTEFFAITFAIIGCYLSWKWMNINFLDNKLKYTLYTFLLAILVTVAWQLKQPYVSTILFPIVFGAIISFIRMPKLKNFIQRIITIIICVMFMVIGIITWNAILKNNNVKINQERTSGGFLARGILNGIKVTPSENITVGDALKIWGETFKEKPLWVLDNYVTNYLATISIYNIDFDGMKIIIDKNVDFVNTAEIGVIGYRIYEYGNDGVFPLSKQYEEYANPYKETNKPIVVANYGMKILRKPVAVVMKISYLLLPILTIISIVEVFRTNKKYNEKYKRLIDMIAILFTFSFLHVLVHALLGSTIDRYTMPALIPTFIGIMLSIYAIIKRKKYLIAEEIKEKK